MNRKQKVTMTIIHMGLILPEKRLNDDDNDNKCNDIYSHWYMVQFVDNWRSIFHAIQVVTLVKHHITNQHQMS